MEFCSKWFFETDQGLKCTRDFSKLFKTKQYYNKKNAVFLRTPALHRLAIARGISSEQASLLIEDMLMATLSNHSFTPEVLEMCDKWHYS